MKKLLLISSFLFLNACVGMPETVKPVKEFDVSKYLGTWYEIARLNHPFEKGLNQVSANYSLRDDGGVSVKNRGFSTKKNKWQDAEGKAYFVDKTDEGHLKVSFFGPFYGSYVIFELDKTDYQYAFVSGPNNSYLWFLSRTPTVSTELKARFIEQSKLKGFNTDELIFVEHN